MEWTALKNQILQNRCKLLEMCFQDSLKKPCRMLTSFAVLSPRFPLVDLNSSLRAIIPGTVIQVIIFDKNFPEILR
jgi:hypothetical protein